MTSVLTQLHGDQLCGLSFTKPDPVAAALPRCPRVVAVAEEAVVASWDIVDYGDLTLTVPHAVSHILRAQNTFQHKNGFAVTQCC